MFSLLFEQGNLCYWKNIPTQKFVGNMLNVLLNKESECRYYNMDVAMTYVSPHVNAIGCEVLV